MTSVPACRPDSSETRRCNGISCTADRPCVRRLACGGGLFSVAGQSYLVILQGIASIFCLFLSFLLDWSQNGAKQGSTNLPAEICLNKITVSRDSSTRRPSALMEHAPPACKHAPRLLKANRRFWGCDEEGKCISAY